MQQENILKTLYEMFDERKYTNVKPEEDGRIIATDENGQAVCVFSNPIEKLNIADIRSITGFLEERKIKHAILIYKNTPTPAVKNIIPTMQNIDYIIELFNSIELQYNITKHELVPRHERLSKKEVENLSKEIKLSQLLVIKVEDPVSRFYNFRKGDVIRILRKEGPPIYRIVK